MRTMTKLITLLFLTSIVIPTVNSQTKNEKLKFDALEWRFIGPIVGTRASVVLGHPSKPQTFYQGASNGLWKTDDAGTYWEPVGDKDFKYGSIGAMEISKSNPDIMYVGMGEPQMRNNVSWGDGVYKSVDGGENWTNIGLNDTRHISQVRIHPTNPDIVYVGAFGHAFGPNSERGVFKTVDGGKTWMKVLYKSDKAGAIDLVMNPSNPEELFATIWEFERKAWGPKTGGPDSGLWKSVDGGKNWTEITYNSGLPEGGRGRTGLTMSAADANRVYALVDSETKAGLYVSNDLGDNWKFVSDYFQIIGRPFYYSHIYASPHDANELWSPNNRLFMSKDGGENWILEPGIKDDFHDIWICPKDPNRMIVTNDGGCQVTMTRGLTWSSQYTQKISQLYRVNVDNDFPYNVYGSIQDLLAYKVPSASRWGGISGYETTLISSGEISSVIPNPDDPNIVYSISGGAPYGSGAAFTVNNIATGQDEVRNVWPVPLFGLNGHDLKYRFNWDLAYFLSPHDSKTIYLGGNVVFKTTDEGLNWEVISPDLTNDLKERQKITGTPWLSEYFGQEIHSTIKRLTESPVKQGVIWSGSDDGKIYITKDGGGNWEDISILNGVPEFSQVYEIEPSPHDAATAYVVFSNFNVYDDYTPYIFKTTDYGKTWTNLSPNFPQGEISRTIREDKVDKGLLFVGTETGVYYSKNDGQSWDKLKANLPAVPVVDMVIKNADLVIATNGRGFWIMDDITPLRNHITTLNVKNANLYPISDHTRFGYNWWLDYFPGGDPGDKKNYFIQNMRPGLTYYEIGFTPINGERKRKFIDAGDQKSLGAVMYFSLAKEPKAISLAILDKNGKEIRNYTKDDMSLNYGSDGGFNSGLNKFVWDTRINRVTAVPKRPPTAISPFVSPGKYTAKLTVDGQVESQEFEVFMNPKEPYTQKQTEDKFAFWMEMYGLAESSTQKVIAALKVKEDAIVKLETYKTSGVSASNIKKAEAQVKIISDIVTSYEGSYVSTGRTLAEVINLPATILFKMSFMSGILDMSEGPVTQSMKTEFIQLIKEAKAADDNYNTAIENELKKLDKYF